MIAQRVQPRIHISRAWACRAMDAPRLQQAALSAKLQLERYYSRLLSLQDQH